MATENILMAAVAAGGDRQDLHERIRRHSQAAAAVVKEQGAANDLLERLKADPAFAEVDGRGLDATIRRPRAAAGRRIFGRSCRTNPPKVRQVEAFKCRYSRITERVMAAAVDSDTIGRNQSFSGQLLSQRSNTNVLGAVVWSR